MFENLDARVELPNRLLLRLDHSGEGRDESGKGYALAVNPMGEGVSSAMKPMCWWSGRSFQLNLTGFSVAR
jgi:hypothetical protein